MWKMQIEIPPKKKERKRGRGAMMVAQNEIINGRKLLLSASDFPFHAKLQHPSFRSNWICCFVFRFPCGYFFLLHRKQNWVKIELSTTHTHTRKVNEMQVGKRICCVTFYWSLCPASLQHVWLALQNATIFDFHRIIDHSVNRGVIWWQYYKPQNWTLAKDQVLCPLPFPFDRHKLQHR